MSTPREHKLVQSLHIGEHERVVKRYPTILGIIKSSFMLRVIPALKGLVPSHWLNIRHFDSAGCQLFLRIPTAQVIHVANYVWEEIKAKK